MFCGRIHCLKRGRRHAGGPGTIQKNRLYRIRHDSPSTSQTNDRHTKVNADFQPSPAALLIPPRPTSRFELLGQRQPLPAAPLNSATGDVLTPASPGITTKTQQNSAKMRGNVKKSGRECWPQYPCFTGFCNCREEVTESGIETTANAPSHPTCKRCHMPTVATRRAHGRGDYAGRRATPSVPFASSVPPVCFHRSAATANDAAQRRIVTSDPVPSSS